MKLNGVAGSPRLDLFLAQQLNKSRSKVKDDILHHRVLVNGQPATPAYLVALNDEIEISEKAPMSIDTNAFELPIVYENEHFFVINKPVGICVHGGPGVSGVTVADLVRNRVSSNDPVRPGIVHRLDKDTTGLLVIAKNEEVAEQLAKMFHDRTIHRQYLGLVDGVMEVEKGLINGRIGRSPKEKTAMAVTAGGKQAMTKFELLHQFPHHALLRFTLMSGRTHQIRVHLAAIKHPIVGDQKYRGTMELADKQLLHCYHLKMTFQGEEIDIKQPLPEAFGQVLAKLGLTEEEVCAVTI